MIHVLRNASAKCTHPDKYGNPCGKCTNCRSRKKNTLVSKIKYEADRFGHQNIKFITLTLTDEMLKDCTDSKYPGKYVINSCFKKKWLSFYKKLRNNISCDAPRAKKRKGYKQLTEIAFVVKMEYGDRKGRPHIHLLLFVKPLEDLPPLFVEDAICKSWYNGIYTFNNNGKSDERSLEPFLKYSINEGKVVKVNPIIDFETLDMKSHFNYIAKYAAKTNELFQIVPQMQDYDEYVRSSANFASDQYSDQLDKTRSILKDLSEALQPAYDADKDMLTHLPIPEQEFKKKFEEATTIFSKEGVAFHIPPFLLPKVFHGYYQYTSELIEKPVPGTDVVLTKSEYDNMLSNGLIDINYLKVTELPGSNLFHIQEVTEIYKKTRIWRTPKKFRHSDNTLIDENEQLYKMYVNMNRYWLYLKLVDIFPFLRNNVDFTSSKHTMLILSQSSYDKLSAPYKSLVDQKEREFQSSVQHFKQVEENRLKAQLKHRYDKINRD